MTGSEALQALNDGYKITRQGWDTDSDLWFSIKKPISKTISGYALRVNDYGTMFVSNSLYKILNTCDAQTAVASLLVDLSLNVTGR
jgi:hypothetical protein